MSTESSGLTLIVGNERETHVDVIANLMKHACDDSTFFVVHSNAAVLHDAKSLLEGDR